MLEPKVTRQQEEVQTLQRFIENRGEKFVSELLVQDKSMIREPCDACYNKIEYQITYGDRNQLSALRKITSRKKDLDVSETYCAIRHISEKDYARELLEKALEGKKNKSDDKMTLLIDCTYTSYKSLSEREIFCKIYFKDIEQRLAGLWQHIFVVFPDGNIQLR